MINLDSLLELLDLSDDNGDLLSLRQSNRAKRLIFKPSVRNGFEIILPRYYSPVKTGKLRVSSNIEVGKQYGSV